MIRQNKKFQMCDDTEIKINIKKNVIAVNIRSIYGYRNPLEKLIITVSILIIS